MIGPQPARQDRPLVGCPVSSENAFTSNTNPSGVRSAHSRLFRTPGSA